MRSLLTWSSLLFVISTQALSSSSLSPTDPWQFHIAYAGAHDMRVNWVTNVSTLTSCKYGLSPTTMTTTTNGTSHQYLPVLGGYHHSVKLSPLSAYTIYYYSCGGGPTFSFITSPQEGIPAAFSMPIFGDWGYLDSKTRNPSIPTGGIDKNWSATLTRELLETLNNQNRVDSYWLVGDIAYADDAFAHVGDLLKFDYEDIYDGFVAWNQNISASKPLMVSAGNHESECHSPACILGIETTGKYLNNFTAYNTRWSMPGNESGGVLNMWYSFNYADVHFVSIDTSTDFPDAPEGTTGDSHMPWFPSGSFAPSGEYMRWLEADLSKAKSQGFRWIIAGGHRPAEDFKSDALLALFKTYGVDLYIVGHGHSYYRQPIEAFGDNTIHIMAGGSGCDEMPFPNDQFTPTVDEAVTHPLDACNTWCIKPSVRRGFIDYNTTIVSPENDPCRYCTADRRNPTGPIYVSDNMALGLLNLSFNSTTSTLTWQLLRSPDGLVLDTLVLTKPI